MAVSVMALGITVLFGCEMRPQEVSRIPAEVTATQFKHAVEQYAKRPDADNLAELCKWSWPGDHIALGEYREYIEYTTLEVNGVQVDVFTFKDAINSYLERLDGREGRLDSQEIAVLRGMVVFGNTLERHARSVPKIVGYAFEQKALRFLATWARSQGDHELEKSLEQAMVEAKDRFRELVKHRLKEIEAEEQSAKLGLLLSKLLELSGGSQSRPVDGK